MCEVTGSSRSYVITDGAQKELIKPFYTFTDCVRSLLFDIGPRRNHSPVRYTSTVAFRPGSHVSDTTPTPSVDVSGWEEPDTPHLGSTVLTECDCPIDLTGHILSPFYVRNLDYQDSRFNSIAHLMCYRYVVAVGQKTFATAIRKWSKHLTEFPTPKFMTFDWIQQGQTVLMDICSHLCFNGCVGQDSTD